MNIKEIIFDVTETKTYQITVSAHEGYDMPNTPKELIEAVNMYNNDPFKHLELSGRDAIDTEVEVTYYEIKENDSE